MRIDCETGKCYRESGENFMLTPKERGVLTRGIQMSFARVLQELCARAEEDTVQFESRDYSMTVTLKCRD